MSHKKATQKFGLQPKLYDYLFVVYLCKILYKWVRWMEFINFFSKPTKQSSFVLKKYYFWSSIFFYWNYSQWINVFARLTYYCLYVLLDMDFSSHLGLCYQCDIARITNNVILYLYFFLVSITTKTNVINIRN